MTDPIAAALMRWDMLVLDGAMGSELERRGLDLADPLWSAKALLDSPDIIAAVHTDYLAAGADIISTASYQATVPGLTARGLSEAEAVEVIAQAARIAVRARDAFWTGLDEASRARRPRPLVAGSIGPWGAYLADGSEFRGDYRVAPDVLADFHRPRMAALLTGGVDLLAFETLPSLEEARVVMDLLASDFPTAWAWMSFSARDGESINDGTPASAALALAAASPQVCALGVNCTDPRFITDLLSAGRRAAGEKPLLAYPNGGGDWDAVSKTWGPTPVSGALADRAEVWRAAGARLLGGCCRTAPSDIAALAHVLRP